MERKSIWLKEIPKGEIRGLLSELLLNEGLIVYEWHKDYFFDCCEVNKAYHVVYEEDVEIIFEEDDCDEDYPIAVSYSTAYCVQETILDRITKELYDKEINCNE